MMINRKFFIIVSILLVSLNSYAFEFKRPEFQGKASFRCVIAFNIVLKEIETNRPEVEDTHFSCIYENEEVTKILVSKSALTYGGTSFYIDTSKKKVIKIKGNR